MKIRKILYPLLGGIIGILAGPGGVVLGVIIGTYFALYSK